MKQRLKNLKKTSLILIAAALVAAIVLAIISVSYVFKRSTMDNKLKALKIETKEANIEFRNKYSEASDDERRQLKENLKLILDNLFGRNDNYEFKSIAEIKEILSGYPKDYLTIVERTDIYSILFGETQGGLESYNKFLANSRLGVPGHLVMAQFTTNLDPIYYYVEFNGENYHVVVDQTADDYDETFGYVEAYGEFLKVEQYLSPDGSIAEYGFLTNDIDLRYNQVVGYFAQVGANGSAVRKPEYWPFYMGIISEETQKENMLAADRTSEEFENEYSGYADLHPNYASDNPIKDMDNDGILDRIYREYVKNNNGNSMVNIYCFLGNGNTITLGKNIWGNRFKTQMADMTGDGVEDICFIQYKTNQAYDGYAISIFEYKNGNYVSMHMPDTKYDNINIVNDGSGKSVLECISKTDSGQEQYILYYSNDKWQIKDKKTLN